MNDSDIFAPYIEQICKLKDSPFNKEGPFIAIVVACMNANPKESQDSVAKNLLKAFETNIGFRESQFLSFTRKSQEERISEVRDLVCMKRDADTLYHFTSDLPSFD